MEVSQQDMSEAMETEEQPKIVEEEDNEEELLAPAPEWRSNPSCIADLVKEAAQEALVQSGYTYDEMTGLYYDSSTGLYYDPSKGLYYNGYTGTYYTFDTATNSYNFYSQIENFSLEENAKNWFLLGYGTQALQEANGVVHEEMEETNKKPKFVTQSERWKQKKKMETEEQKKEAHSASQPEDHTKKTAIVTSSTSEEQQPVHTPWEVEELEDGELRAIDEDHCSSPSDSHSDVEMEMNSKQKMWRYSDDEDSKRRRRKKYKSAHGLACLRPPCMRLIVINSSSSHVKVGSLFIVPYTGGFIGREKNVAVHLPDINVSKLHACLEFDALISAYTVQDLGSRNGTFINGERLSESFITSEPVVVEHGQELKIASTVLRCHVHIGTDTCDDCEPGLIQCPVNRIPESKSVVSVEDKEFSRRKELKALKKKFGLTAEVPEQDHTKNGEYRDRAGTRRKEKGIDVPNGKVEAASIDQPIDKRNKGFKMLSKMGWSSGEGLGKDKHGQSDPILVEGRLQREGLGAAIMEPVEFSSSQQRRSEALQKTRERFEKLE
nr:EOG090X0AIB [Triops cancriformis]